MPTHDLIIVGSGSAAGIVAGEARDAGWSVAMIDKQPIGGTCANRGCDPKKVLVSAAAAADSVRRLAGHGVVTDDLRLDWPALARFTRSFTDPVPASRERALRAQGIDVMRGVARFLTPSTIAVNDLVLEAGRAIVLAAGARPADLRFDGADLVADSTDFLALRDLPARIAFIGGGYISMEFAHVAARAGAHVTVLHRGERPLEAFDGDLVTQLVARTRDLGVDLRLETTVTGIARTNGEQPFRVSLQHAGGEGRVDADLVVHGAGRVPDIDDLDCAAGGVAFGRAGIAVDPYLRNPDNPMVWAAGDCAASGAPPLTPIAGEEGHRLADNLIRDARQTADYRVVPSCVFTVPPLARVGWTEAEARASGSTVRVQTDATASWASARRVGESASAYKVIVDAGSDLLLGVHLLGPHADEVINVFAIAMQAGLTTSALKAARFAYPTHGSDIRYML